MLLAADVIYEDDQVLPLITTASRILKRKCSSYPHCSCRVSPPCVLTRIVLWGFYSRWRVYFGLCTTQCTHGQGLGMCHGLQLRVRNPHGRTRHVAYVQRYGAHLSFHVEEMKTTSIVSLVCERVCMLESFASLSVMRWCMRWCAVSCWSWPPLCLFVMRIIHLLALIYPIGSVNRLSFYPPKPNKN